MQDLTGRQPRLGYDPPAQRRTGRTVIDIFALAVSHGLILLALWRLIGRDDLDGDPPTKPSLDRGAHKDA